MESEKSYGKHLSLYNALKVAAQSPGGVAQLEPTLVPLKLYLDSMSHAGIRASSPHHNPTCSVTARTKASLGLQPDRVCEP